MSPCDPAWGHCCLHHECPLLGEGAPEWMAVDKTSYNGEEKDALFISTLSPWPQQTDNGSGTAWHGMAEEIKASLPFIFPPCRQTDRRRDLRRPRPFTFIPVWPPFDSGCRQFVVDGHLQGPRLLAWIALKGPCGS